MTETQPSRFEPVVACSLTQADLAQRQQRWLQLAERACTDRLITGNGLRLVFRGAPGIKSELTALATLERDCCAFAAWSVREQGDKLVLDVSADSAEGIAAVRAMFAPTNRETAS